MDLHSSFTNFDIVLKMRVLFSLFRVHGRVICIVVFKKKCLLKLFHLLLMKRTYNF